MSTSKILLIVASLLTVTLIQAQEIKVTVAENLPVSIQSLDFETTLDQVSMNELKRQGIDIDVSGTQTSAQGTSYKCTLRSVPPRGVPYTCPPKTCPVLPSDYSWCQSLINVFSNHHPACQIVAW